MSSSPFNSGWHSRLSDDLTRQISGTRGPSPPIDSIPPGFVLLDWDDVAPFRHPLSHYIPRTPAQTLGLGFTSPYDNQARTLCPYTEAETDGELNDFNSHRPSNILSQLSGQSAVLETPSEPHGIDQPVQAQIERPHIPQSASNPRRRRAYPRSKAQGNRYQTRSSITKCTG